MGKNKRGFRSGNPRQSTVLGEFIREQRSRLPQSPEAKARRRRAGAVLAGTTLAAGAVIGISSLSSGKSGESVTSEVGTAQVKLLDDGRRLLLMATPADLNDEIRSQQVNTVPTSPITLQPVGEPSIVGGTQNTRAVVYDVFVNGRAELREESRDAWITDGKGNRMNLWLDLTPKEGGVNQLESATVSLRSIRMAPAKVVGGQGMDSFPSGIEPRGLH